MNTSVSGLTILLVENHEDTLTYLVLYLKQRGHRVLSARSIEEALAALSGSEPDVLISDIGLSEGDGWELMRRAMEIRQSLFGIAMSGFSMRADKEKSLLAGFRHHLIKPFLPEDLDVLLTEAAACQGRQT